MTKVISLEDRKKKLKLVDGKPFFVKVHNVNGLPMMKLDDIKDIQGDLKEFRNEEAEIDFLEILAEKGIILPFFAWKDKKGVSWMVDGSGRRKLVNKYDVQSKEHGKEFPVLFVPAKNKKQAAEIILQISSNWHKATKSGMEEFINANKIDFSFINKKTTFDFYQQPMMNKDQLNAFFTKDGGEKSKGDKFKIIFEYSIEGDYKKILIELKKVAKTPEGALQKLLEFYEQNKEE